MATQQVQVSPPPSMMEVAQADTYLCRHCGTEIELNNAFVRDLQVICKSVRGKDKYDNTDPITLDELSEQAHCARCVPYPCFTLVLAVRQMSEDARANERRAEGMRMQKEFDEREALRLRDMMSLAERQRPKKGRRFIMVPKPKWDPDADKRYGDERRPVVTAKSKKRGKKNGDPNAKGGKRKGSHKH